ncbi:DNA-binding protein [Kingella negevensis]|uniref:DNA-binding protein n=1 Tax=Kingella negevensis TaxID=1522312 RepID=UPI002542DCC9|nr:DNA-binding protein [Kingella negevensis]WII93154.1 DNA-binding protein [Kingella negevensis]WII93629.1 DNA-binding protein [Kingella negevensis]
MAITIYELKKSLEKQGKTLADWARENNYTPRDVYLVVGGQNKARYGREHEIAVKLGLKDGVAHTEVAA